MILGEGAVGDTTYIENVLPVALRHENDAFGSDWIFQQRRVRPHSHHLTQQWRRDIFPSLIDKDRRPPK